MNIINFILLWLVCSIKTEPELEIAELEEMLELPDTETRCMASMGSNPAYQTR